MSDKEIIGGLAVLLSAGNCGLYLWQIFRHGVKPHVFSWFIWGILGMVVFAAQYVSKAGPGAWVVGSGGLFCFVVAFAGLFRGEKRITRSDWIVFIFSLSLSAIPAWVATSDPVWAVIIATTIDTVAFYPTIRKSWIRPHEEAMVIFFIYALQMGLSLLALESYTVTTALNPVAVFIMNIALALMLLFRRRVLA